MHCCISFSSHSSRQHKWIASRIFFKNSCREEKLCFQVNPHAQSMPAMVEARLSAPFVFLADEARMTFSSFFWNEEILFSTAPPRRRSHWGLRSDASGWKSPTCRPNHSSKALSSFASSVKRSSSNTLFAACSPSSKVFWIDALKISSLFLKTGMIRISSLSPFLFSILRHKINRIAKIMRLTPIFCSAD